MEELDLKKLFTMFWTRKIQIIVIVIVFALVGAIYTLGFTMPVYSARTTLLLATQQVSTENSGTMNTDVTLNTKLVSTYSELIKSNDVLREVKQNLHSDVSENQMKKNIKVSSVKDTSIIEITVLNESASVAADIANEIANVFSDKVKDYYKIDNVHVVDKAEPSNSPSNINHRRDILIFTLIGIVISVLYVLLSNLFDTTISVQDDFEKEYGVTVLAEIPTCDFDGLAKRKKGGKRR